MNATNKHESYSSHKFAYAPEHCPRPEFNNKTLLTPETWKIGGPISRRVTQSLKHIQSPDNLFPKDPKVRWVGFRY